MTLTVEQGAYAYNGKDFLYHNINFEVSSGEVLSILGTNGSGKTTLLKCVMNLLKFNEGNTYIDGRNIKEIEKPFQIISYVPQAKGVHSSLSAVDMVLLGLSPNFGLFQEPKKEDIQKVLDTLEELDILYLKDKLCDEISGGELQMILMARAMISNPQILVLDEPESNLDFKNQLTILKKIKELVQQKNMICIINTHYPDHAYQISNKILLINKKTKSSTFGSTKDIITVENLKEIFDVNVLIKEFEENGKNFQVIVPY